MKDYMYDYESVNELHPFNFSHDSELSEKMEIDEIKRNIDSSDECFDRIRKEIIKLENILKTVKC